MTTQINPVFSNANIWTGSPLYNAVLANDRAEVQRLLENKQIPNGDLISSFFHAVEGDFVEAVSLFLASERINEDFLSEAFFWALQMEKTDMAKIFIETGRLCPETLIVGSVLANHSGNPILLDLFRQQGINFDD